MTILRGNMLDRHAVLHACPILPLEVGNASYGDLSKPAYACGCQPLIHRFKCNVCGTMVGWCCGGSEPLPYACSDCYMRITDLVETAKPLAQDADLRLVLELFEQEFRGRHGHDGKRPWCFVTDPRRRKLVVQKLAVRSRRSHRIRLTNLGAALALVFDPKRWGFS